MRLLAILAIFIGIATIGTILTFLLDKLTGFPSVDEFDALAWIIHHIGVFVTGSISGAVTWKRFR